MNAKTADYASAVHWDNIIGRPGSSASATDIGQLKGAGFRNKDLVAWNGKRFASIKPSTLFDTSTFYSQSNKPYTLLGFNWNPGTLTPFLRKTESFILSGATEGSPVAVGVPYSLQGCSMTADWDGSDFNVTLFNQTPYDVTLADDVWGFLFLK